MKPLVASLLFFASGVGVLGTNVNISGNHTVAQEPKEPPSTASAVRGEFTISEATKIQAIQAVTRTPKIKAKTESKKNSVRSASVRYNIPSDPTHRCPQFESKLREHGLEPVDVFSYIAWRESRCTPTALNSTRNANGSKDYGLLQINSSWKTLTSKVCQSQYGKMTVLYDVDCNLKVARFLLDNTESGLGNWRVYKES